MKPFLIILIIFLLSACDRPEPKKVEVVTNKPYINDHFDSGKCVKSLTDSGQLIHLLYPDLDVVGSIGYRNPKGDDFFKFYGTSILSINKVPEQAIDHYIVLFRTVPYDSIRKEVPCIGCQLVIGLAELVKQDNYYKIGFFKESIQDSISTSGFLPTASIEKMGVSKYALVIRYKFAEGALNERWDVFYQIPTATKIFAYNPVFELNVMVYADMPIKQTYSVLNKMFTFLPSSFLPEYYELSVVSKMYKYNSKKNREDEVVKSEYYKMDTSKSLYVKDSLFNRL